MNYKTIMSKIKNKEDLSNSELLIIERLLKLNDINEEIINYQIEINNQNKYELTRTIRGEIEK